MADQKLKKLEELRRIKAEKLANQEAKPVIIMNTGTNSDKVNELLEKAKNRSSILVANEELVRGGNMESRGSVSLNPRTRFLQSLKVISFSDSLMGNQKETFEVETNCNLYEEVKSQIEAQLEEEMQNTPNKEKERNYGYIKKVFFIFK